MEPLTALPEPDYSMSSINCLTRWQLIERMHRDFWTRWSKEYLHQLHQRSKLHMPGTAIKGNTFVLVKSDTAPPCKWQLGRITQLHPGADDQIRVATVRTVDSVIKRPIIKLCPLPIDES